MLRVTFILNKICSVFFFTTTYILVCSRNESKATRSPEITRQQVQKLTPHNCVYCFLKVLEIAY